MNTIRTRVYKSAKDNPHTLLKGQAYRMDVIEELLDYVLGMKEYQNYCNYEFDEILEHLECFIEHCKDARDEKVTQDGKGE